MNFIPPNSNWILKQTRTLQDWKQEFIRGNHRQPTDREIARKVNEIIEWDGFMYRPTRAEYPFNCDQCDKVQNKTCDEIDASMVAQERRKHLSDERVFTTTPERLKECCSFSDEDGPYCNDRAEPCRFTHRTRCHDYKSVIHHQVECDVQQGTFFAQQMVRDAQREDVRK